MRPHRAVLLPVMLLAASLLAVPAQAQEVGFSDTDGTSWAPAVNALAELGTLRGCETDRFCATDELTRGQAASIVARALDLPAADTDNRFDDTAGDTHADAIEAVAEAGIVRGCDDDRFCPRDRVTRGQLATMLYRAFDVPEAPASASSYFTDVSGSHAPAIAGVAEAGITNGCDLVSFCPTDRVQRAHAAVFFARALDLVDRVEVVPLDERQVAHDEQLALEDESAASDDPGMQAVEVALEQLGKPYAWGGNGPDSFDCSGLTRFAWAAAGVDLPRTSADQHAATTSIDRGDLRPGDLVFYHSPVSHVAIYIGDGKVVEAPNSGNDVRIREDGLTRSGVVGFGRP